MSTEPGIVTQAGRRRVVITYLGGHFNGEQELGDPLGSDPRGDVIVKRAELVRRGRENGPVTFADDTYHLRQVAPGWWIAVHESIQRSAR